MFRTEKKMIGLAPRKPMENIDEKVKMIKQYNINHILMRINGVELDDEDEMDFYVDWYDSLINKTKFTSGDGEESDEEEKRRKKIRLLRDSSNINKSQLENENNTNNSIILAIFGDINYREITTQILQYLSYPDLINVVVTSRRITRYANIYMYLLMKYQINIIDRSKIFIDINFDESLNSVITVNDYVNDIYLIRTKSIIFKYIYESLTKKQINLLQFNIPYFEEKYVDRILKKIK